MSRFHRKYHSHNHHTTPLSNYPDSASDPIASASHPFNGDFHIDGNIVAESMVLDDARFNVGTFESLSAIELSAFNIKYDGSILNATTRTDGSNAGYVGLGHQGYNSGVYGVTLGYQNSATGAYSLASGANNISQGELSTSIGVYNKNYGGYSFCFGDSNRIYSITNNAYAIGSGNIITAGGFNSCTIGFQTSATTLNAFAIGDSCIAKHPYSIIISNVSEASTNRWEQFIISAYAGVDLGENVCVFGDFEIKNANGVTWLTANESSGVYKSYYNQSIDKEKILSSFIINPPIVYNTGFGLSAKYFTDGDVLQYPINVVKYTDASGSRVVLPSLSSFAGLQKSLISADSGLSAKDYGIEIKVLNKTGGNIYIKPDGDTIDSYSAGQSYGLSANVNISFIGNVKTREWFSY